jgi:hypothetical protein
MARFAAAVAHNTARALGPPGSLKSICQNIMTRFIRQLRHKKKKKKKGIKFSLAKSSQFRPANPHAMIRHQTLAGACCRRSWMPHPQSLCSAPALICASPSIFDNHQFFFSQRWNLRLTSPATPFQNSQNHRGKGVGTRQRCISACICKLSPIQLTIKKPSEIERKLLKFK